MEPTSKDKEINTGARAQVVYDGVKDRFDMIRANLHDKWEGSTAPDSEGREHAWNMLKALNELERSFLTDIETGKLAQLESNNG